LKFIDYNVAMTFILIIIIIIIIIILSLFYVLCVFNCVLPINGVINDDDKV